MEIKRRGDIDGVEQLTRYLELMNRDPHLAPVTGVFAAQEIKPQARTLAEDRGIRCVTLDYDAMRGVEGRPRPPVLMHVARSAGASTGCSCGERPRVPAGPDWGGGAARTASDRRRR